MLAKRANTAQFPDEGKECALICSDLSLALGGVEILASVNLEVAKGEVIGLVGPNGAGKTSLLNTINGVYRATSGSIEIFGNKTTAYRPHRVAALGVARTFQNGPASTDMTVADLALLGRHLRIQARALPYALGITALRQSERQERGRVLEALALLGLDTISSAFVVDLPFGKAKLADLARALCSEPQLLLLDEPVSGLDSKTRSEMVTTIRNICGKMRIATVIVEHDMGVVRQLADRIVVLSAGRVLLEGEPAEVLADPEVRRVFLGEQRRGQTSELRGQVGGNGVHGHESGQL